MIAEIEGNIQEEVNIVPIVSKLEELGKKCKKLKSMIFPRLLLVLKN